MMKYRKHDIMSLLFNPNVIFCKRLCCNNTLNVSNVLSHSGDGAGKRKSKRKSSSATEDHHENDTQENPRTSHNTYLDLHVKNASNSTVCEITASETKRSIVEVVTFIDPRKKHKVPKIVDPVQKVTGGTATCLWSTHVNPSVKIIAQ